MTIKTILFSIFAQATLVLATTTSLPLYAQDNNTYGWCLVSPHMCDKE
ncbi:MULTISPECIES: hypothetical protein [Pseudoalteromonas]|nr:MULTISPECIES: hypothetical protein [Pseudoalteromonas]MCF6434890.1 hypothetical protein [Pseudoalteromonas sp. MMG022]